MEGRSKEKTTSLFSPVRGLARLMLVQAGRRGNSLRSYGSRFIRRSRSWKRGSQVMLTLHRLSPQKGIV